MKQLTNTEKDILIKIGLKYGKKPFSIDEIKELIINDEHYTKADFSNFWLGKLFTENDNINYIRRHNKYSKDLKTYTTTEKFELIHLGLQLIKEQQKANKITHIEKIEIIKIIISSLLGGGIITTLINAFLN